MDYTFQPFPSNSGDFSPSQLYKFTPNCAEINQCSKAEPQSSETIFTFSRTTGELIKKLARLNIPPHHVEMPASRQRKYTSDKITTLLALTIALALSRVAKPSACATTTTTSKNLSKITVPKNDKGGGRCDGDQKQ